MNPLNLFKFLEKEKGKPIPLKIKLIKGLPLTPEELDVKGYIDLYGTSIISLPPDLKIEEHLLLTRSSISSLSPNLQVGRNLYLMRCKNLTSLPENLQVGESLYLIYTRITSLPPDLKVGKDIHIGGTSLAEKTDKEIRAMLTTGYIKGMILRGVPAKHP
jgi:hypothetical protein